MTRYYWSMLTLHDLASCCDSINIWTSLIFYPLFGKDENGLCWRYLDHIHADWSDSFSNHGNSAQQWEEMSMCVFFWCCYFCGDNLFGIPDLSQRVQVSSPSTLSLSLCNRQSKFKTRQRRLHPQDPMFFPEMSLIFKDACSNVLKADSPPRYISLPSISAVLV